MTGGCRHAPATAQRAGRNALTGGQLFAVEPVALMAVLGLGFVVVGLFRQPLTRLGHWFIRQPLHVIGLLILAQAGFFALPLWWRWPLE
jgi:hypothetical protein